MTGSGKRRAWWNASLKGGERDRRARPRNDDILEKAGEAPLCTGANLADLIRRPRVSYAQLARSTPAGRRCPAAVTEQVEIALKYEGYIKRQLAQVRNSAGEERLLPEDLDYGSIRGLRVERARSLRRLSRERGAGLAHFRASARRTYPYCSSR